MKISSVIYTENEMLGNESKEERTEENRIERKRENGRGSAVPVRRATCPPSHDRLSPSLPLISFGVDLLPGVEFVEHFLSRFCLPGLLVVELLPGV